MAAYRYVSRITCLICGRHVFYGHSNVSQEAALKAAQDKLKAHVKTHQPKR